MIMNKAAMNIYVLSLYVNISFPFSGINAYECILYDIHLSNSVSLKPCQLCMLSLLF